jgi:aspartyl-tRNA synthetase
MKTYGNDKPDIRFGMEFGELNEVAQNKEFPVFNAAELVVGMQHRCWKLYKKRNRCFNRMGKASTSRCFRNGLCKCNEDGTKSSVDKFYDQDDLSNWAEQPEQKQVI